eukprot:2348416-Rhodomonas_salina.1
MVQDDEEETEQHVAKDPKTGQPLRHRLVSTEDTLAHKNVDGEGDHWDESQVHFPKSQNFFLSALAISSYGAKPPPQN